MPSLPSLPSMPLWSRTLAPLFALALATPALAERYDDEPALPDEPPAETNTTIVRARAASTCTAAIALRDNVPAEQKLGTQAFTVPYLLAGYDRHRYLTATDDDDGRARWTAALAELRDAHCVVDLYFLAHGATFVRWIEAVPVDERPRLRLVYDTGGADAWQGPRWIEAGARSFVGHPGGNIAPVFYAFFLPAWLRGDRVDVAVKNANARTKKVLFGIKGWLDDGEAERLWAGTEAQLFGDDRAVNVEGLRRTLENDEDE